MYCVWISEFCVTSGHQNYHLNYLPLVHRICRYALQMLRPLGMLFLWPHLTHTCLAIPVYSVIDSSLLWR